MFKKLKETLKKALVSVLSATTVTSGLAAAFATPVSAASYDYAVSYTEDNQFYWQWNADGSKNPNWGPLFSYMSSMPTFTVTHKTTGKSFKVFCIQQGVQTKNGDTYSAGTTNPIWDSYSTATQTKIRYANAWLDLYHPNDKYARYATQGYIWHTASTDTFYGTKGTSTTPINPYINWDTIRANSNSSVYSSVKSYYDQLDAWVTKQVNKSNVIKWNNTRVTLSPGQSVTITDTNGVFGNPEYSINTTGLPSGITMSKSGNSIVISVSSSFSGTFSKSIKAAIAFKDLDTDANNSFLMTSNTPNHAEGGTGVAQALANVFPLNTDPTQDAIQIDVVAGKIKVVKTDASSGARLAGARFEVRKQSDNSLVTTLTTNASGEAETDYLDFGNYIVTEVGAPTGYNLSVNSSQTVALTGTSATATFSNKIIQGTLKVVKYSNRVENKKLAGATFEVYQTADRNGAITERLVDTIITDQNGEATTKNLDYGEYYVVETIAPTGYNKDETHYPFDIKVEAIQIQKDVYDKPIDGKVKLIKSSNRNNELLKGAIFEIHRTTDIDGNSIDVVVGTLETDEHGEATSELLEYGDYYLVEVKAPVGFNIRTENFTFEVRNEDEVSNVAVTNKPIDGKIKMVKYSNRVADKTIKGAKFELHRTSNMFGPIEDTVIDTYTTGDDGTVTTGDLEYGEYYFIEVEPPTGYTLDESRHPISIEEEGVVYVGSVYNKPIDGRVQVIKYSDRYPGKTLAGARFEIHRTADIDGPIADVVVGVLETDANGQATSDLLEYGEYYLREIKAPTGYNINETRIPFAITTEGETIRKEAYNKPIDGKIKIVKYNEFDGTTPLERAIFEIHRTADIDGPIEDTVIGRIETDSEGIAISELLEYGDYYFIEVQAPTGFNINTNKFTFEIEKENVVVEKTVYNKPIEGYLRLIKYSDRVPGKTLKGAVYNIHRTANMYGEIEDTVVATIVTDSLGVARSEKLEYGDYYAVEVQAPVGYNLDPTPIPFSVLVEGLTIEKEHDNKPIDGRVKVLKLDTYHDTKLVNAIFKIYRIKDIDGNIVEEYVQDLYTNADGIAVSNDLEYGDYYLVEVQAPNGYVLDTTKRYFEIREEEVTIPIEAQNKPIEGKIKIYKKGDYITPNSVELEGVKFEIHRLSDMHGSIPDTVVGTLTTDKNGYAESEMLEYGSYYLVETEAAYGYYNSREKIPFSITKELQETTFEVNNQHVGLNLSVVKYDSNKDGKGVDENSDKLTLEGAEFELWEHRVIRDLAGNVIREEEVKITESEATDANGHAEFGRGPIVFSDDLVTGSYYYIKEVKAPFGYLLNENEHRISFNYQGQDVLTVEVEAEVEDDFMPGKIKVIKTDGETTRLLAGAKFEIKDSDGKVVDTVVTDSKGEALTKDLRPGTYTVTEIEAPAHYQNKNETKTTTLKVSTNENDEAVVEYETLLFEDIHDKGTLNIIKTGNSISATASSWGATNPDDNTSDETKIVPLQGAVFAIYEQSNLTNPIAKGTTDVDGKVSFTLNTGKYYYQEIKAPKGYVINPELVPFELVNHGDTISETFNNESILGSIKVYKIGEKLVDVIRNSDGTLELIWKNAYMSGTKFEIRAEEDITDPATGEVIFEAEDLITTLVTNENGEATLNNLPLGKYTVEEVGAPLEHSVHEATSNVKYIELTAENANFDGAIEAQSVFVNKHLIIDPTIYKIGARLNDPKDESKGYYYEPLAGVVFGIYNDEDIVIDANTTITKDTLLTTMTTDKNGQASSASKLPFGKYYLKEIKTVDGFYLDENKYEFELVWNEEMQENDVIVVKVSDKENPIINYEIPMPDTGINMTAIWTITGLAALGTAGLVIVLKKRNKEEA